MSNISNLDMAEANGYYFDGFGIHIPAGDETFETSMWYYLFLAAEAGEI